MHRMLPLIAVTDPDRLLAEEGCQEWVSQHKLFESQVGFGFDLPDTLAGKTEVTANLLEGAFLVSEQPIAPA
jgi:hypothetical protein